MQFKKAPESPVDHGSAGGSGTPRTRHPQWLVNWINERGQYVILECGHKESLAYADTTLCLIRTFPGIEIHCQECDGFRKITGSIGHCEYMNISLPEKSSIPQF